jgi:DNA polymerase-4
VVAGRLTEDERPRVGSAEILHVDLDAFYVGVEQRRNPVLVGKPVVVGGGVVLSASYEARQYGVQSAMPLRRARELCPRLVVVSGEFGDYASASDEVFEVCERFTPLIEQMSIDEAFLDVSGAHTLFGSTAQIASAIRSAVREETGLVVSIGGARTKFLAKVASRVAKPDGLIVVEPERETDFLHGLTVDYLWGVGPTTQAKLAELGIHTVADLATTSEVVLARRLGAGSAAHLHALAWNRDPRRVTPRRRARSVGAQSAFARDCKDEDVFRRVLANLADRVGRRLRRKQRAARTITLRIRYSDFRSITRSRTLRAATSSTSALYGVALDLLRRTWSPDDVGIGLLGIRSSNIEHSPHVQLEFDFGAGDDHELFRAGTRAAAIQDALDQQVDELREKFGPDAVGFASALLQGRRDSPVPVVLSELMEADRPQPERSSVAQAPEPPSDS